MMWPQAKDQINAVATRSLVKTSERFMVVSLRYPQLNQKKKERERKASKDLSGMVSKHPDLQLKEERGLSQRVL